MTAGLTRNLRLTQAIWTALLALLSMHPTEAALAQGAFAADRGFFEDEDEGETKLAIQNGFQISDENFEMWIYGNQRSAGGGEQSVASRLKLRLDEVDRGCGLTELQKQKLLLAGTGDIKHFLEKVERVRKRFKTLQNDQNKINEIWQDVQPLRTELHAGLFGDTSLFHKVQRSTLTPEQIVSFNKADADRRLFRYRASVGAAVLSLGKTLALREDQRQALTKLLEEMGRPPRKFGHNSLQAVLCQLNRVPVAQVRPIFDDVQWRALERQLTRAKGMERALISSGELPEAEAAVNAVDKAAEK